MLDSLEEFIPEIFILKDYFLNRRRPNITKSPDWVRIGCCYPKQIFSGQARSKNVEISAISYTKWFKGTEEFRPTHQEESKCEARAQV